ncbi:tryptophan-rich sensory protein [Candidatus Woesebacteria bacterium]|nr:tryptophan-rich sensory protein [Candidatus Woesebacteria bacterium]
MKIDFKKLVVSLTLPFLAGFIGSYFTTPSIPTWYASLNKPKFNPPNWLFGPVWTILYILMGISFYIIWNKQTTKDRSNAFSYYLAQLILNSLWSIVFFGFKEVGLALVVITILWFLILKTIFFFEDLDKTSSNLLIPYILWVSFATILNFSIYILN